VISKEIVEERLATFPGVKGKSWWPQVQTIAMWILLRCNGW